jgi:predicted small metal-binding protein
MKTTVNCPCGETMQGKDEDELVEKVQAHLADKHPDLKYNREQILSMAS